MANDTSALSATRLALSTPLQRPTQVVILAGGRGNRMRPLTDTRPKPMVEIHGKPFLEYQIEQLREQGFNRILLLLGYLPEVIQSYFGTGSRWGVQIDYSISEVDDETARRLKLAEPRLDPHFLLLYCDNYWPMCIQKMWPRFIAAGVPMMITVYTNKDGYSRNSIRVDGEGYVTAYDKSNGTPGMQGVEISYALVDRSVVRLLSDANVSVEAALYGQLARERQLLAYTTDHRYYSVGSKERLPLTEAFLARCPAVLLDRDGVLNKKPARAEYVRSWSDFEWLPGAKEALRLFNEAHYEVVIISNQAGIGRKLMTEADLLEIHGRMTAEAEHAGGRIDRIYFCPHGWDDGCECRKPKPGLLFQAQRDLNLDLSRTPFVGDDERDGWAADAAGCPYFQVSETTSLLEIAQRLTVATRTAPQPIPQSAERNKQA